MGAYHCRFTAWNDGRTARTRLSAPVEEPARSETASEDALGGGPRKSLRLHPGASAGRSAPRRCDRRRGKTIAVRPCDLVGEGAISADVCRHPDTICLPGER